MLAGELCRIMEPKWEIGNLLYLQYILEASRAKTMYCIDNQNFDPLAHTGFTTIYQVTYCHHVDLGG